MGSGVVAMVLLRVSDAGPGKLNTVSNYYGGWSIPYTCNLLTRNVRYRSSSMVCAATLSNRSIQI